MLTYCRSSAASTELNFVGANSIFASPHHLQTVVTIPTVFMIVIAMQPWPLKRVCRGGRRAMGECLRKPLRITLQPSWLSVILHLRPGQLATLIGSLLFHFQEHLGRLISVLPNSRQSKPSLAMIPVASAVAPWKAKSSFISGSHPESAYNRFLVQSHSKANTIKPRRQVLFQQL